MQRMAGTRMMQTGMNRAMMAPRPRPINGMMNMPRSMMQPQRRPPMGGGGRMSPVRQPSARMDDVRMQRMDPNMMDPRMMMMGRR